MRKVWNFKTSVSFFKRVMGVLAGSALLGIGYSWFLIPFKVAPGGVGGLAQIFLHFLGWQPGVFMILANIPLWIMGMLFVGRQFGWGTFVGFFTSSAMTDLLSPHRLYEWGILTELIEKYNRPGGVFKPPSEWAMTDDIFLAAIAGAILLGAGVGIIFKSKASTGGTDIPVALMKKYLHISIGNGYLIVESGIIFIIGLVFSDLNIVIWSFFALFLSSRFADIMTEGLSVVKSAYIICSKPEAVQSIKERIYKELDRGVTFFEGEGAYAQEPKKIIYVTFGLRQTAILKSIAVEEDPGVFMVMQDVHDVVGFGFKSRSLNME